MRHCLPIQHPPSPPHPVLFTIEPPFSSKYLPLLLALRPSETAPISVLSILSWVRLSEPRHRSRKRNQKELYSFARLAVSWEEHGHGSWEHSEEDPATSGLRERESQGEGMGKAAWAVLGLAT